MTSLYCPKGHNLMGRTVNRLRPGNEWFCFICKRWFRRDECRREVPT